MADIGGVACTFVKGSPKPMSQVTEIWRVPGYDGYGIQLQGLGDGEHTLRAIFYSTPAGVVTWYTQLLALQGTIVNYTTDWGIIGPMSLVRGFGQLQQSVAVFEGDCRGECEVQLLATV